MWKEEVFVIYVDDEKYFNEPIYDERRYIRFKVSLFNDYLFTLKMSDRGAWETENNISPEKEKLINKIGKAIEEFDV